MRIVFLFASTQLLSMSHTAIAQDDFPAMTIEQKYGLRAASECRLHSRLGNSSMQSLLRRFRNNVCGQTDALDTLSTSLLTHEFIGRLSLSPAGKWNSEGNTFCYRAGLFVHLSDVWHRVRAECEKMDSLQSSVEIQCGARARAWMTETSLTELRADILRGTSITVSLMNDTTRAELEKSLKAASKMFTASEKETGKMHCALAFGRELLQPVERTGDSHVKK